MDAPEVVAHGHVEDVGRGEEGLLVVQVDLVDDELVGHCRDVVVRHALTGGGEGGREVRVRWGREVGERGGEEKKGGAECVHSEGGRTSDHVAHKPISPVRWVTLACTYATHTAEDMPIRAYIGAWIGA